MAREEEVRKLGGGIRGKETREGRIGDTGGLMGGGRRYEKRLGWD